MNLATEPPEAGPRTEGHAALATLVDGLVRRYDAITRSIATLRLVAIGIVALAITFAYAIPLGSSAPFILILLLFVVQGFATAGYRRLLALARSIASARAGIIDDGRGDSWLTAAACAVQQGYFALLIIADASWLASSYIHPHPAASFEAYLEQLRLGAISGTAFLVFTAVLWLAYAIVFVIGIYRSDRLRIPRAPLGVGVERGGFRVTVMPADGRSIVLRGFRVPNHGGRPLILWPGFFQNGHVWDLEPGVTSLAEFLQANGYDLWIMHSRGTADSGGCASRAAMDDYASCDIPAVIDYVTAHTGQRPIYVGHSQGGITAIISMMGAIRRHDGTMALNDAAADERQAKLAGLVTLGSFLDFTRTTPSAMGDLARNGVQLSLFGLKITLLAPGLLLAIVRLIGYVPVPVGRWLRRGLMEHRSVRVLCAPVHWVMRGVALLGLWEFLYHVPNIGADVRVRLLNLTMDSTFAGILRQFYGAVVGGAMHSLDDAVNYSASYHRLRLPVSYVAMEHDGLADPVMVERVMFAHTASTEKHFTSWSGVGHEDHFMRADFFPWVLEVIRKIG